MTDTTKRYRLRKDIDSPELKAKAGDIGKLGTANKVWFDNGRYFFYKDTVESTYLKEWFEVLPVSEPVPENTVAGRSDINFDKQVLNPHPTGTSRYTNWEQGFLAAANKYAPIKPDAFVWDDKLVLEFCNAHRNSSEIMAKYYLKQESIEAFKKCQQSKQSAPEPSALPTKEWEITCFKRLRDDKIVGITSGYSPEDYLNHPVNSVKDGTFAIHSVKRLSDNTVFSVGDELDFEWKSIYVTGSKKIQSFNIEGNELYINGDDWSSTLASAKKLPITDHPTQPVVETISSDNTDVAILSVNDVMGFFRAYFDTKASMHPTHGEIRDAMIEVAKQKLNK